MPNARRIGRIIGSDSTGHFKTPQGHGNDSEARKLGCVRFETERCFFACEKLFQRLNKKGFLHRIVTDDDKWIHCNNTKYRKARGMPGRASTSTARPNIHDAKVMLCIWCDTIKLSSGITMLSDMSQPVKTYLETLKWEILPHLPYSPDLAPSDYHLLRSMEHGLVHQNVRSYAEVKKLIDSWIVSKDASFFRDSIQKYPERWKKVGASHG